MDQVSRIRFKNLLERLLTCCDGNKDVDDKAVMLRIGVVTLNKLRIHGNVGASLGCDVVDLNKLVTDCTSKEELMETWDDMVDLVRAYKNGFS